MQAVLENLATGELATREVPSPELRPGGILVQTAFSAISAGTERAQLEQSEKSLLGKALARPDLVKRVITFARTNGLKAAYHQVQARLDAPAPLGYSCSGTVIGVGEGVTEFHCGDRVACAGAGYANHCEVNWVPRNLAVRVPDSVSLEAASLTTIGAIASQGLRQAQVSFGETVLVIGAGLVGVLTIQFTRAAGCRIIALDLDPRRVEKAHSFGAHLSLLSSDPRLAQAVNDFSRYGADAAIVTAASTSSEPLELAAQLLRDRGRIAVVGTVGMGISRHNMFRKEITLAMSRSYGPGRYDPEYEEEGKDYPVGYVRWTERRNMEAFLDLLASGSIDVSSLIQHRCPVQESAQAFAEIREGRVYTVLLEYPAPKQAQPPQPVIMKPVRPARGQLRVGCIGAGNFATGCIFPNLKGNDRVSLHSVATVSGIAAESAKRNFQFSCAQTPSQVVQDPEVDAVFIASRHQSHGEYVAAALRHGKAVFVEKPLAANRKQLDLICQTYRECGEKGKLPFLMVGFNRRFAPFTGEIRRFFAARHEPMMLHARINAGFMPLEHWTQQRAEGGRIIGELCHFVDWARYMIGASIRTISAAALADCNRYNRDNIAVTLTFADSSIANLLYLANGAGTVPKEYFEIFCEGSVARLEDFETLQLVRNRKTKRLKSARDKGHRRELQLTLEAMLQGKRSPIPFAELAEVTATTFSVAEAIGTGQPISVSDPKYGWIGNLNEATFQHGRAAE